MRTPELSELRSLIQAAGGSDEQIMQATRRIGLDGTVAVLVDELVSRSDLEDLPPFREQPVIVRLRVGFHDEHHEHVVCTTGRKTEHGPAGELLHDPPDASLDLELVPFVRAVFGPAHLVPTLTGRGIGWRYLQSPQEFAKGNGAVAVVERLLRGTRRGDVDLAALSSRHDSDKWGLHYYTPHYERHFGPLRDRPLTVLELGVGGYCDPAAGGGSLRMWKRYFPRAVIFGVDIFDKSAVQEQRIRTVRGDQSDQAFLQRLAADIGPFDIVIDDGSHYCPEVIGTFQVLFDQVSPGGLYVIEDLQTSYWKGYGGSSEELDSPSTSMGFLKRLLDGLNHEEYEPFGRYRPNAVDRTLVGAHFYHNLVVLEKGVNAEGTVPAWVQRQRIPYEKMVGSEGRP